ncbi:MAG TPA: DinB family protein [Anseongella sp.]|nr:DinB family protein [Anseongella sp.]
MKTEEHIRRLRDAIDIYEKAMARYSEPLFRHTPAQGVWSLSEMYSHIMITDILGLSSAGKCIRGEGRNRPHSPYLLGRLLLLSGRFPPFIRFNVPRQLESTVKKISLEEAAALIAKVRVKLQHVSQHIAAASPGQKIKHPVLGYLNAAEWVRFVQIHTEHHLGQLNRIEKLLQQSRNGPEPGS